MALVVRFTLETNCLIAVAEGEPDAVSIRALLARHAAGTAVVQLTATSAAERQPDGTQLDNFSFFQEKVDAAGLGHLEILLPIALVDFAYLDWCVFASDDDDELLAKIHNVLFPSRSFERADAVPDNLVGAELDKADRKWRNHVLDVLALHCHIRSGNDVFVTSDENFLKATKVGPLVKLGAGAILRPADAASYHGP